DEVPWPPRIAVNVSPIQLRQRNFVEAVRRSVEDAGVEGCQLDLEITEGLIMRDIEENIQKLSAIREMGLQIAVDDFGTGYSDRTKFRGRRASQSTCRRSSCGNGTSSRPYAARSRTRESKAASSISKSPKASSCGT